MTLKRTPLYSAHQKLGGKLIEFGGWEMPVQYTSITDEHLAVRQAAGIFDISHMGEVWIGGAGAEEFLNRTLTNDVRKLAAGQGQYTLMCNERGGTVDDLYVYRLNATDFLLILNASRMAADVPWLEQANAGRAELRDLSGQLAAVAVQGPRVAGFIDAALPGAAVGGTEVQKISDLKKNQIGLFILEGATLYVARTGYTGEEGFEIVAPAEKIEAVWNRLLEAGRPAGLKPAGLGARDTLRTEMGYPLYGHELDEQTTPLEAGVGFFVALEKGAFTGRSVLAEQKAQGVAKKLVAFKMTGKSAPPRPHYPIWANGASVGVVTSGTQSPTLNLGIGLGYVPPALAKPGTPIDIEIRGKPFPAVVAPKPLYRPVPAGV
jgi:aminomethyltransferase